MDSCAASTACPLLSAAALLAFSDSDAILPYSRKTNRKTKKNASCSTELFFPCDFPSKILASSANLCQLFLPKNFCRGFVTSATMTLLAPT
jgi:hypothetical protein